MQIEIKMTNFSKLQNNLFALVVNGAVLIVVLLFLFIVGHVLVNGVSGLNFEFLTQETSQAGRAGGIAPIIVSTIWILMICLVVMIPVGLGAAIFLSEFTKLNSIFQRLISRSLDVLAGMPSIIFGLFGNVFFCKTLGLGFSILSGGLTLACMALPLFIRTAEIGLRTVPSELRLGGLALGYSHLSTLWHLILPAAVPSLLAGLALGIGRALAETAALIFTSGYVDRMPESILDSGRALSVHIYDLAMNVPGGDSNAYKSALTLIVVVLSVNFIALNSTQKLFTSTRGVK